MKVQSVTMDQKILWMKRQTTSTEITHLPLCVLYTCAIGWIPCLTLFKVLYFKILWSDKTNATVKPSVHFLQHMYISILSKVTKLSKSLYCSCDEEDFLNFEDLVIKTKETRREVTKESKICKHLSLGIILDNICLKSFRDLSLQFDLILQRRRKLWRIGIMNRTFRSVLR